MNRYARQARKGAVVTLHSIARPYFSYPPLEDSAWYLPEVIEWEPWNPPANAMLTRLQKRYLVGKRIVPSLVYFTCTAEIYLSRERKIDFKFHLKQRTLTDWRISYDRLWENIVVAERLSVVVQITGPGEGREVATVKMPALAQRKRPNLFGQIWRDLWELENARQPELPSPGHSATGREINRAMRELQEDFSEHD